MNAYITLDGKQYAAPHGQWAPATERPVVVRRLLSGGANVTFGPANMKRWQGTLIAAVTPETGYGSVTDLRATYEKLSSLTFTDHYGNSFNVIIDRSVDESSRVPNWDSPENKMYVKVMLVKV
jgi:hypothetical protein